MPTLLPLLSLVVSTALAPAPVEDPRLQGELVQVLREEAGVDVAALVADWERELRAPGPVAGALPPEAVAPAVRYDRGLSRPLGEMVLQVPVLSF